jgi:3-oxoacyl-[acyl-carrier-protein] synthase-3
MTPQLRGAGIIGIGSFAPKTVLTNADIEKMVDTSDEWIVTRSGIRQRHIVGDEDIASSDLGAEAARHALESAGIPVETIDLVICATISGDMPFPSTACLIQDKIGAVNAAAFDLQAGCSGWVYALSTGAQFIRSGMYDHVLVVGADVLSRYMDWTDRSTCVLFGDAGGAAVLGPVEAGAGILGTYLGADGSGAHSLRIEAGGSKMPTTEKTVREGLHHIKMEGREVFKFAVKIMGEASLKVLDICGLTHDDVDLFVPHQANTRIIDAAAQRLDLPPEKVFVNVANYVNTSAASIPMALDEAYHAGKIREGDVVVVVGFGAGLTWAAGVLKWTMPTV